MDQFLGRPVEFWVTIDKYLDEQVFDYDVVFDRLLDSDRRLRKGIMQHKMEVTKLGADVIAPQLPDLKLWKLIEE